MKSVLVLLLFTQLLFAYTSGDAVMSVLNDLGAQIRCTTGSVPQYTLCANEFTKEIKSSNEEFVWSELKTRRFCCAFKHLEDCISSANGNNCPKASIAEVVALTALRVAQVALDERCDPYKDTQGDFLCLQDYILVVIGIAVIIMALFAIILTVKLCTRSGRRSVYPRNNAAHMALLEDHNSPVHNSPVHKY